LLAYRELDDVLGLMTITERLLVDGRTGQMAGSGIVLDGAYSGLPIIR